MDGHGRNVQFPTRGSLVQGFDVLQDVPKSMATSIDLILRQRVKHKGVVRIRRMTKKKFHGSRKRKAELAQEQPDTGEARNVNAGRTMTFLAGRFSSVVLARSRRCRRSRRCSPLSALS